ncbi:lysozyme inhibitor LprI family protein [Roseitranquillus sediminis]|uniref:lysozyme inhibitor LprI family protein n=1 Tax=Roseitranquillus sediminis TaxID=2809051 RepID=UPI001D0C41B7|nr:lysozyme inhibitor LprI family protein [Roseitranquillus sediminis]
MRRLLAVAFLVAAPAAGEDFVPGPYIEVLAECYGNAESTADRSACIGEITRICEEEEPQGATTLGMATCAGIEADAWDVVLEGEYRLSMEWARAADRDDPPASPSVVARADALRTAQRAWEDFQEAECHLAFARWGSGSMRQVAASRCRMRMIAERAVALRALREDF